MDIFESLENLNVSEECFNDIIDKIEETLQKEVAKNFPNDLKKNVKAAELSTASKKEVLDKMSGEKDLYHPSMYDDLRATKNEKGQQKTDSRKSPKELADIQYKRSARNN
jgi:hypothetical protein